MAARRKFNLNSILEWSGFKDPDYIGIDIESTSIITTELTESVGGTTLEKIGLAELPADTIKNSEVISEKNLLQSLARLKNQYHLNRHNAVIAASSKLVTTHYAITQKEKDEKKRSFQAQSEAKKVYPEMYTDLYIDHALLSDEALENEDKQKLLLVASHKTSLQPILNATDKADISTKIIDIDYYTLQRSFALIKNQIKNNTIALLNVEASTALLAILENEKLIHHFHQGFTIPGYEKLIRYTLECIEPNIALEESAEKRDISAVKLSPVLENQLVNQLKTILSTYSTQADNPKLEKVILSGRSALIPDIDKLLTEKLGIETVIINPFQEVKIGNQASTMLVEKLGPACLLSCGLAMRNLDNDKY